MSSPAYSLRSEIIHTDCANSVHSGSDKGDIDYDNHSFDSDDDWATPPREAEDAADAAYEASESDEEEILGRLPRKGGNVMGGEAAGNCASHSPAASANGGKSMHSVTLGSY
jgi:hypothetical protein